MSAVCKSVRGVSAIEAREALVSLWSAQNERHASAARSGNESSAHIPAPEHHRDSSRSPLGVMLSARVPAKKDGTSVLKSGARRLPALRETVTSLLLPLDVSVFASGLKGDDTGVHLGSMNHMQMPAGTPLVALLTPQGEQELARTDSGTLQRLRQEFADAEAQAPGKARRSQNMRVTLNWHDASVERVYIPREKFQDFMSAYRKGIAAGAVPKNFGSRPYTQFFVASDDIDADLRAAEMRRRDSAFAARSPESQKATAALAHRAAAEAPESIPYTLRLNVYEALIRHERLPRSQSPNAERFYEVAKAEKRSAQPFHHGTRDAAAIAKEGFRSGDNNLMGKGIYYGNPSVAAQYANRGPASRKLDHEQVISGRVLAGETTSGRLPLNDFIQSAIEPMPMEGGSYHVTREAERFQIRAITTMDPALAHESLQDHLPDLLALCALEPDAAAWAGRWLDAFSNEELRNVSRASVSESDFREIELGMQTALLSRGDPAAVSALDVKTVAALPMGTRRCVMGASLDALENAEPRVRDQVRHYLNECSATELELAVSERMKSPLSIEVANRVLEKIAAPKSMQRMLVALREEKPVSAEKIRQTVAPFKPEAQAKLLYELGRKEELRTLLHDAAEIEATQGNTTSAMELLLRNSEKLDDAAFAKWSQCLQEKNQEELDTIAFQLCTKDERWVPRVMDVLAHKPADRHFASFCRAVKGSAYQPPALGLGIAALSLAQPADQRLTLLQSVLTGIETAGSGALTATEQKSLQAALSIADETLRERYRQVSAL